MALLLSTRSNTECRLVTRMLLLDILAVNEKINGV